MYIKNIKFEYFLLKISDNIIPSKLNVNNVIVLQCQIDNFTVKTSDVAYRCLFTRNISTK